MSFDIYQSVTNSIIEAIEAGHTAEKFQMPWSGFSSMPTNAATENHYRGINIPVLWVAQLKHGYKSGTWATYKQWQERGAQVRKGEKASQIVFWKSYDIGPQGEDDEAETRAFAKWSAVFNADQVDGYEFKESRQQDNAEILETAEQFMTATGADIRKGGLLACYHREGDYIALPDMSLFHDTETSTASEAYYSTTFHELTHWTGAAQRLERDKGKKYGDPAYAFEEIIAELGAAMLSAKLGITNSARADHAQYVDGWLKALKNDKKFIFSAASQAQKAADYLMGKAAI
jgi:antirestriction protein ArdC